MNMTSAALLLRVCLGTMPADAPLLLAQEESARAAPSQALSMPAPASPGAPSSSVLMVSQMESYLDAERSESKLFVGMGALSIAGGAVALAASDRDFLRGASLPLMGVGLIQLVVGGSVWWRTEEQKAQLRTLILSDPSRYVSEESARMKQVNDNFVIYRWTEISLLGAGAATAGAGYALDKDFVTGLGVGLAFQSAVMLALDYFAEKRGNEYASQVAGFRF
ncbi:MAG TPA: hypothetical protein VNA24_21370 [Hyalangium sp.]|jgi:hypothetical protein|nr:hypothetical protein [Hyalangium sp.]